MEIIKLSRKAWMFIMFVALTACGGAGGDSDGNNITYIGETDPANITASNVEEFVDLALGTSLLSNAIVTPLNTGSTAAEKPNNLNILLADMVSGVIQKTLPKISSTSQGDVSPQATTSDTIVGDCGGSYTYTITMDDVTGDFSGSMSFDNYCSGSIAMNGSYSLSGNYTETRCLILVKEFLIFYYL